MDRGEGVAGFVLAAAVFNLGIWAVMGPQKAEEVRSRGPGGLPASVSPVADRAASCLSWLLCFC